MITADAAMDNANPENLKRLEADAMSFITEEAVDLELTKIAKRLMAEGV